MSDVEKEWIHKKEELKPIDIVAMIIHYNHLLEGLGERKGFYWDIIPWREVLYKIKTNVYTKERAGLDKDYKAAKIVMDKIARHEWLYLEEDLKL